MTTSILDRVAAKHGAFRPKTCREFFAFRLAQKLGEPAATAAHYLPLAFEPRPRSWPPPTGGPVPASEAATGRRRPPAFIANLPLPAAPKPKRWKRSRSARSRSSGARWRRPCLSATNSTIPRSASSRPAKAEPSTARWRLSTGSCLPLASPPWTSSAVRGEADSARAVLSRAVEAAIPQALPSLALAGGEAAASLGLFPPGPDQPPAAPRHNPDHLAGGPPPNGKSQVLDAVALGLWVQTERYFL